MKAKRILLMACCLALLSANAVFGQTVDKKRLKDISFDDVKFDIVKGAPFKRFVCGDTCCRVSNSRESRSSF